MTLPKINEQLPPQISQTEEVTPVASSTIGLTINSAVLNTLLKEDMSINELFILIALHQNKIDLLDLYDNNGTRSQVLIYEYQNLHMHGFLDQSSDTLMYGISEKGIELVEELMAGFECQEEQEPVIDTSKLSFEYLELFPKIKLPSQKYARSSAVEIEKKLKTFIRNYRSVFKKHYKIKLTNELILAATRNYVDRYAKDGYKFMVTSSYFIQKNEKSALADEILAISQGLDKKAINKFEKRL